MLTFRRPFVIPTIIATLILASCGSPVPSGIFLTMNVSTRDVTVKTSINGKANAFLSGDSGSMTASIPLNRFVKEGENHMRFELALTPDRGDPDPGLLATLEISLKGETVDTLTPGDRAVFTRELEESEIAMLFEGETITIEQQFLIEKKALEKLKSRQAN